MSESRIEGIKGFHGLIVAFVLAWGLASCVVVEDRASRDYYRGWYDGCVRVATGSHPEPEAWCDWAVRHAGPVSTPGPISPIATVPAASLRQAQGRLVVERVNLPTP